MAKQEPPIIMGAPAWTATFGDLMNLLLCFFVLLFSMSSVDAAKFEAIAASFSSAAIFPSASVSFLSVSAGTSFFWASVSLS